jgi:hypothetical protein
LAKGNIIEPDGSKEYAVANGFYISKITTPRPYAERLSRKICRVYDVKGVLTAKWWNHIFLLNSFRGWPSSRWALYATRAVICSNGTCTTNISEKL